MNRRDRHRAEAAQRAQEHRMQKDAEERKSDNRVVLVNAPEDIKRDIAKTVRSIEWTIIDEGGGRVQGGICFWRAFSGGVVLNLLDIKATPALGGMVYRAGADEVRDVVSFCGPGNIGQKTAFGLLAHYFIVSGNDIVDFSPGDWRETYGRGGYPDLDIEGRPVDLGPIQWMVSPPEFFWAPRKSFEPIPGQMTPELGHAWYTGFAGDTDMQTRFEGMLRDAVPSMRRIVPHIRGAFEHYALKQRVWAHVNGHTAMRMSHLVKIVTDPELAARAQQMMATGKFEDRLIVVRGKVEISAGEAASILTEALK